MMDIRENLTATARENFHYKNRRAHRPTSPLVFKLHYMNVVPRWWMTCHSEVSQE